MSRPALRSDWRILRPVLVFVVTKKVREGLRMLEEDEFRLGCDMAGAKAHLLSCCRSAGLKPCPCYKSKICLFSGQ